MDSFSSWFGYRQVVESAEVSAALSVAEKAYPRLRQIWDDGVLWLLGEGADKFGKPASTDQQVRLHVFAEDQEAGIPSIWLIYRVSDGQVDLLHVKFEAAVEAS